MGEITGKHTNRRHCHPYTNYPAGIKGVNGAVLYVTEIAAFLYAEIRQRERGYGMPRFM
jgi:hypothetical protein